MKKHWITLFPDTFIWTKNHDGFIYNSKKNVGFHFLINDRIARICRELLLPANLYTTVLTNEDMENDEMQKWIHSVTKEYAAGYLTSAAEKRPLSFKPILKMLNDVQFYVWENHQGFGGSIMRNIHELTFYLNKTDTGNNTYFRQAIFPLKYCSQMDPGNMLSFIRYSLNPFLSNINLVGNIFLYPDYKQLINKIASLVSSCTIRITIQDFKDHLNDLTSMQWPDNIRFIILIDYVSARFWVALNEINIPASVTAFICSENEYDLFFDQFKDIPVYCDAQVIPVYNGNNLHFFKNNVFIAREDLHEIALTKREIFMHQVLNTNDFGKLTIFPNGSVYANVNKEPLGTIRDTVYSLVLKELTEGQSWLRIRNQAPCSNCIYQWLCPSPSNYEIVVGRPNLCHLRDDLP